MVAENWATAVRARAIGDPKECRRLARHVGLMVSYGLVFILLSVLVPGISMERQITFASAAYVTWTHLTVHEAELPPV